MPDIWLLGGFPGLALGVWASFTPMRENQWTLLSLFGVGSAMGAVVGFGAVTALVASLNPLLAAGWILALLTAFFFAGLGCLLGRVVALLVSLFHRAWQTHRALFAVALGLTIGLMTGGAFAAVTVGAGALEQWFRQPPG